MLRNPTITEQQKYITACNMIATVEVTTLLINRIHLNNSASIKIFIPKWLPNMSLKKLYLCAGLFRF